MMPWKNVALPSSCATFANVSSMGRDGRLLNRVTHTFRSAER